MPYNIPKLDLDITGINANNKIIDEPHALSGANYRSAATNLGPFFAESLIVKDGAVTLTRGTQYQVVELHQEASLRYGKEISSVVLITDPLVNTNVTLTYQALGGHYSYSNESIARVYESVSTDNRSIAWSNIFNKPTEYPPTVHRHLLDDVYGFEPVVDALERIKRAITIGQVDVVVGIINSLVGEYDFKKLGKVFPVNKHLSYDHFLFFITQQKLIAPVSVRALEPTYTRGGTYTFYVDTTGLPPNTPLYWELYNPYGIVSGIRDISGVIDSTNQQYISIYIPADMTVTPTLYLGIRIDPNKEDFDAVTYRLEAEPESYTNSMFGILAADLQLDNALTTENNSNDEELRLYYSISYQL